MNDEMPMSVDEALMVVARHAVAHGAENIAEDGWDTYPEVGEYDWEKIGVMMANLCPYPDVAMFERAMQVLKGRADFNVQNAQSDKVKEAERG